LRLWPRRSQPVRSRPLRRANVDRAGIGGGNPGDDFECHLRSC
jgi:hypothetical protein